MAFTRREFLIASAAMPVLGAPVPARLARKDCFLGMHFDLHPRKNDTVLGRDVTDEMVERFLDKVKPDYVQYDCKGHAGYLGFPSKTGTPSPGIVNDSLAVWRRVTARRGVALFIHFSGVWDSLAISQHPEWARVRPDGKPEPNQTSTFGPYADALMIPELEEAARLYDLDGAWVDGECWATNPDYSEAAARAFKQATGIDELPKGFNDPGWLEFLEFNRQQFRRYVMHYIDALHKARPKFQIASNWLYSTFVPERPELPVDFISGDYLGNASISTARLEARYMAQTGMPWDLMAWGFARGPAGPVHKSAVQLQQESAVVLAQGGGFQIYYQPTRAGKLDDRHIDVMARVAEFCRARQALSHKSEMVPQIGVLFSTTSLYSTSGKLFGSWGKHADPARGLIDALLENHYPVDVIPEWKLSEAASEFPVIAVPDWPNLGAKARDALADHTKRGGKLLVVGAENSTLFAECAGVRPAGVAGRQSAYVPGQEVFADLTGTWQDVDPLEGTRVLAQRYPTFDSSRDGKCAATLARCGAGTVAAIHGPVGSAFAATHAAAVRELVRRVVAEVFAPNVEVTGPPTVEVSLRRKGGRLLVHLINCTAMQVAADYATVDFIPEVGPLELAIRLPRAPQSVTFEPGGKPLAGEWKNGTWRGTVDRLAIHGIVAVNG